jgi:hypothetical protein
MPLTKNSQLQRIRPAVFAVCLLGTGIVPLHAESVVFRLNAAPYRIGNGRISMQGFGILAETGAPRLPSRIFCLALNASASVNGVSFRPFRHRWLTGSYDIEPVPPLLPAAAGDGSQPSMEEFETNRNRIYTTDRSFPENPAVFLGVDTDGGNTVVKIRYAPFQYNPVRRSLDFVEELEVRIQYSVNGSVPDSPDRKPVWLDAERTGGTRVAKTFASEQRISMLILTSQILKRTLEPFLFWKRCLGDSVCFTATESVYSRTAGADRAEKIRNFLRDGYFRSGITDVLLIGHKDILPVKIFYPNPKNHRESGGVPSDFYFSELTGDWDTDRDGFPGESGEDAGDWAPEIRAGRIPWSDSTVVGSVLENIIRYEKSDGAWKGTPLLVGGISNYRNEQNNPVYTKKTDGAVLMEWLRQNAFTEAPSFTLYEKEGADPSEFDCSMPLNGANLFSAWGNGASGCVTWWMHGGFDALERKFWNADDGNGIPDSGELTEEELMSVAHHPAGSTVPAVLYANACENGWPEKLSLGRELLKDGCAAVLAASRTSWYSPGWSDPEDGGNASLASYFWEAHAGRGALLGAAVSEAQVNYLKNFGSAWQHVQNAYTLMLYGDPTQSAVFRPPVAGSLAGKVILDDENDPAGLRISLKGTDRRTAPDASGRFSFGFLAGGDYVLTVDGTDKGPVENPVSVVNGEACSAVIRILSKPAAAHTVRLSDSTLAWTVQEGLSEQGCLRISNPGPAALNAFAAIDSSGAEWVSVGTAPLGIPPGAVDSILILVHADRLFRGSYESALCIRTNIFSDSPIRVPLHLTVIDTVPPAPIDDLELTGQNGDTLALAWSAPGDNELSGQASQYEFLAGSSDGVTEDTVAVLLETSAPSPAGSPERAILLLEPLLRFRSFWIMIRTLDDAGLFSVSNKVPVLHALSWTASERMGPGKTRLGQNYPNPFNGSTRIGFSLEKASDASVSVLDASGRVVRDLCAKRFSAGRHEIEWDSTDQDGRVVSSGVYLVQIRAPNHLEIKKMLLLR